MFLGIDWGKFVDLQFWLTSNPGELSRNFEIFFIIILVIFYGGYFVVRGLQKKSSEKKDGTMVEYWRRAGSMFMTMAISFTFLFFFREEGVPYLGGRYMFLLWTIAAIVWIGILKYYYFVKIPKIIKERSAKATPTQNFNNPYQR